MIDIRGAIEDSIATKKQVIEFCLSDIQSSVELMIRAAKENKSIFWCGNGGSAADSQHMAAELMGGLRSHDRRPVKSIALTTDSSFITAWSNDTSYDEMRSRVMEAMRNSFRPEFLNRIDDTVLFKPLSLEEITEIVDLLVTSLNKRLEDRKISVGFTDAARKWIGEKGYDPTYGARPLKRFLQKQVETQLARALVAGEVEEGCTVAFSVKDDELVMKVG